MSRAKANKLYRNFAKGLITEAGYLTYPENASTDELNTVIKKKGSRSRRFGLDYEEGSTETDISGIGVNDVVTSFYWAAADENAAANFFVVQVNSKIHFFGTPETGPISANRKSFSIDLYAYKSPAASEANVRNAHVQMASGKGFLFVVSPFIEPLVVEYHSDTQTIGVTAITIRIRDFEGLNDELANDEEPTTLSKEHFYNLRNQGWVAPGSKPLGDVGTEPVPPPPPTQDPGYYDPWRGDPREPTFSPQNPL